MNLKGILQSQRGILSVFLLVILAIGGFLYANRVTSYKNTECTTLGRQLGKENRARLQNLGQDKTNIYEDEYVYNQKLKTCLYYKKLVPFVYDAKEDVAILNAEIIDASTNKTIISLVKALNPEIVENWDGVDPTSCLSSKEWNCKTENDFYRIKMELFK